MLFYSSTNRSLMILRYLVLLSSKFWIILSFNYKETIYHYRSIFLIIIYINTNVHTTYRFTRWYGRKKNVLFHGGSDNHKRLFVIFFIRMYAVIILLFLQSIRSKTPGTRSRPVPRYINDTPGGCTHPVGLASSSGPTKYE